MRLSEISPRRAVQALLGIALLVSAAAPLKAQTPTPPASTVPGITVDSVMVEGNRRIDDAAVLALAGLRPGARVVWTDVQQAIRRLMATGDFETVDVYSAGDPEAGRVSLIVQVEERPFVTEFTFRGLERISGSTVRDTVGLQPNQPLDPSVVLRTEKMIRDLLTKQGVQVLSVDTVLTPVSTPEGAFRLTFDVREGNRLSVAEVVFEGNEAFEDDELSGALSTRPEGFFWFRSGQFDPEVFREDLARRLPEFYARHGFIDFAVLGDTMIVDPETGKAQVTIRVAEGPRYRLGSFEIEGNSAFPTDELAAHFTAQRRSVLGLPFGGTDRREKGEVFDRSALDAAIQQVQQEYRNAGYLYAQVAPVLERVPATGDEDPVVNVTWAISERSPFYIRRVAIEGNTYTHESVIRDRLFVFPGDVYNEDRVFRSYQSIGGLGFFETPMPMPDIQPNPETGEVDLVFRVKEKQTGSLNFGTMLGGQRGGGFSGFVSYTQPNLFGQAKQSELHAEYGYGRRTLRASYTDPALFGTRNSGTVSLFHTGDRYYQFEEGRRTVTGASLRYGMPVPGMPWGRMFLGYSLSRTALEANESCAQNPNSIFCLPAATASSLSLGVTRDTRNHPSFPTLGTRQSLSVAQTGGPLGGDGNYQKVQSEFEWWVPVSQFGGGTPGTRPVQTTLGLQLRTGAVFGDASPFPLERFYLGGTQFGQQLRGYEERTITPLGYQPRNVPLGMERLGDAFLVLTAEYAIRLNDNISVSAFGDAGNIWSEAGHINPTRLYRGAGLGLTLVTPFGPLGIDYAYGFDLPDPKFMFHFKLGAGQ